MNTSWYHKWWGILILFILFFVVVFGIVFAINIYNIIKKQPKSNPAKKSVSSTSTMLMEGASSYWLGSANPKITIVEFADYQCPLCKSSFPKIREISAKYKNDVKIIHRDFPVFANSANLSLAALCAGEQGLFWPMHDKLFQNQGKFDAGNFIEIKNLAQQTGINTERFNQCFDGQKYLDKIKKDIADGQKLEITGTPTWFINGEKIEGDIPYETFINLIENILDN